MTRFAITIAGFVWICCSARADSQGPLFDAALSVVVGPGSGQVVLADINRDGHLDMVTRHLLHRSLAVLLGDGKSGFSPVAGSPMRLDYQPGTMAYGDVNNDRIVDLGITSRDSDREHVNILLGNGRGGFSPASGSPFTASPSIETYKPNLHFVDINEDGKLDILTANGRRNTIEALFGDGRGGFSPGPTLKLESGRDRYSFAVGDVDGDGHLDLVIASSTESSSGSGRVVTMRGNGKGAFKEPLGSPVSVPQGPRVGMVADVNHDRRPDITLGHGESNLLSVLLNHGNGGFRFAPGLPIDLGRAAFEVVVADVNRDKLADLVVATVNSRTPYESRIAVLLGGSRGFAPAPGSPFRAGPGAYTLTVGDVNEDGKLDVAASSFEGNAVTVLFGR